jgi:O-acetylserine/cysteine efflux transporter
MDDGGKRERRAFLWVGALVVLAVVWGGSIPATKLGLRELPPLTLTALRYLAAAPFFAVLLLGRRLPPRRALLGLAGLGILGIAGGQVSQSFGVASTSAAAATVISATIPILVVLFAAVRLRQPIATQHALGLATAFIGVGIVAVGGPRAAGGAVAHGIGGDALVLLSTVAIALFYVLSVELVRVVGTIVVVAWSSLAGAAALLPFIDWDRAAEVGPTGLGVVLYLALLVTVAGNWVWLLALQRLPVRVAAALQYLQPIVGVAASAAIFGDTLDLWFAIGTFAVLAGIALGTVSRRPPGVAKAASRAAELPRR